MVVPLWAEEEKEVINPEESAKTCSMVCEFACVVRESFIFGFTAEPFECPFVLFVIAASDDESTSVYARDKFLFRG